jgi:hypothetical protein
MRIARARSAQSDHSLRPTNLSRAGSTRRMRWSIGLGRSNRRIQLLAQKAEIALAQGDSVMAGRLLKGANRWP